MWALVTGLPPSVNMQTISHELITACKTHRRDVPGLSKNIAGLPVSLFVCLLLLLCVCVCLCVCACMHTYMSACLCTRERVRARARVCLCVCVCVKNIHKRDRPLRQR